MYSHMACIYMFIGQLNIPQSSELNDKATCFHEVHSSATPLDRCWMLSHVTPVYSKMVHLKIKFKIQDLLLIMEQKQL